MAIVTSGVKFDPFTYEQLAKPMDSLVKAREEQIKEVEDKRNLAAQLSRLNDSDIEGDKEYANRVNTYLDSANSIADFILNNDSRDPRAISGLIDMKHRYDNDIKPIADASALRDEIIKDEKKYVNDDHNNYLVFDPAYRTSLEHFMNGQRGISKIFNLNDAEKEGVNMANQINNLYGRERTENVENYIKSIITRNGIQGIDNALRIVDEDEKNDLSEDEKIAREDVLRGWELYEDNHLKEYAERPEANKAFKRYLLGILYSLRANEDVKTVNLPKPTVKNATTSKKKSGSGSGPDTIADDIRVEVEHLLEMNAAKNQDVEKIASDLNNKTVYDNMKETDLIDSLAGMFTRRSGNGKKSNVIKALFGTNSDVDEWYGKNPIKNIVIPQLEAQGVYVPPGQDPGYYYRKKLSDGEVRNHYFNGNVYDKEKFDIDAQRASEKFKFLENNKMALGILSDILDDGDTPISNAFRNYLKDLIDYRTKGTKETKFDSNSDKYKYMSDGKRKRITDKYKDLMWNIVNSGIISNVPDSSSFGDSQAFTDVLIDSFFDKEGNLDIENYREAAKRLLNNDRVRDIASKRKIDLNEYSFNSAENSRFKSYIDDIKKMIQWAIDNKIKLSDGSVITSMEDVNRGNIDDIIKNASIKSKDSIGITMLRITENISTDKIAAYAGTSKRVISIPYDYDGNRDEIKTKEETLGDFISNAGGESKVKCQISFNEYGDAFITAITYEGGQNGKSVKFLVKTDNELSSKAKIFRSKISRSFNSWLVANPDATEDEIKEEYKTLFNAFGRELKENIWRKFHINQTTAAKDKNVTLLNGNNEIEEEQEENQE